MEFQKRNRELYLDNEALATLRLCKEGILSPIDKLLDEKEAKQVDKTSLYKNQHFPFSFILAPSGKRNEEVIKNAKKGSTLDIIVDEEKQGEIIVEDSFKIDKLKRVKKIFTTTDPQSEGVERTLKRLGNYAISGEVKINSNEIKNYKSLIQNKKRDLNAKNITAIMISAKPFHRAHERMIRIALENADMVVLFLLKPYTKDLLSYQIRYKTVKFFVDNFLPKNRVLIIPFENTYLFDGFDSVVLDAIAAKNYGCTKLAIGQNHRGIGLHYDIKGAKSIKDSFMSLDIGIEMEIVSEFSFCNECKTLVSQKSCPHGKHHHITYNTELIYELLKVGLLPPAVLVRKEISAIILSELYPDRFKKLYGKFSNFFPGSGLIEEINEIEFYRQIMDLYQTASLT